MDVSDMTARRAAVTQRAALLCATLQQAGLTLPPRPTSALTSDAELLRDERRWVADLEYEANLAGLDLPDEPAAASSGPHAAPVVPAMLMDEHERRGREIERLTSEVLRERRARELTSEASEAQRKASGLLETAMHVLTGKVPAVLVEERDLSVPQVVRKVLEVADGPMKATEIGEAAGFDQKQMVAARQFLTRAKQSGQVVHHESAQRWSLAAMSGNVVELHRAR